MNFFKTFLANLLAIFVSLIVFGILLFFMMVIFVASSSNQDQVVVRPNSILHLRLNYPIVENAAPNPVDFNFDQFLPSPFISSGTKAGLYQMINAIDYAATDENISGMYINLNGSVGTAWANLSALREAIGRFKDSGKFIYAYSEMYTESTYYLASMADSVFMPPEGMLEFNGLGASPMFLKGLFDKLEIEPKVFRVGTFKSAVEPYTRTNMSKENKLQTSKYINEIWDVFARGTGESRGKSRDEINELANSVIWADGKKAEKAGLIDQVAYGNEVIDLLKAKSGVTNRSTPRFISLKKYLMVPTKKSSYKADKIAVVVAEGTIMPGKSTDGIMGSGTIVKALRTVRKDKRVKAVVLRINSPGGSLLASDMIKEEVRLTSLEKPIFASMGNVAASGGYYIAAMCDTIYAQENTITGSIGVFSVLFNTKNFMGKKLGITFDEVATHEFSGIGNPGLDWSPAEEAFFQRFTEKAYGTFINVVKEGRNFPDSLSVDKVSQGRVWTGKAAKELKLVDEIGNLRDVIHFTADRLGLEEYRVQLLPKPKTPIEELIEGMNSVRISPVPEGFQKEWEVIQQLKRKVPASGTYMLMPYDINIQ